MSRWGELIPHDSDECTQDQRCDCMCNACDEYCCSKDDDR